MDMKRLLQTGLLVLTLIIFVGFQNGIGSVAYAEESEEYCLSDYETLMDTNYWMNDLYDLLESASEEERAIFYAVNDGIGFLEWDLVALDAMYYAGKISIRSIDRYNGGEDTLLGMMHNVEPVAPEIISKFLPENQLMTLAFGNPHGSAEALLSWLFDGDAFVDMMSVATGVGDEFKEGWNNEAKPIASGYVNTLREVVLPYLGDEKLITFYWNEDFIGWEDIDDATDFYTGSPVRFILAGSMAEPGFADSIMDIIHAFYMATPEMIRGMSGEFDPGFEIDVMEGEGYIIHYIDLDESFQIAWTEFGGVFFLSDLQTIQNLRDYYNPRKPVRKVPARYNSYFYFNFDNVVGKFLRPLAGEIRKELCNNREYADEMEVALLEMVLEFAELPRDIGCIEAWSYNSKKGLVSIMNISEPVGPFILDFFNMADDFRGSFFDKFAGGCMF